MLTPEQKEARKNGLGGTDVAAILGLSPYMTAYELWMIKTGKLEQQTILNDDRLRLRHAHEETIAREYAFRNQCRLRRVNKTLYHKKHQYMLCHLDRVVIGQRKIIECKSSTAFMKQHWGEQGTDQVYPHYIVQVQHQLAISGYDHCVLAALIDIDDYREYPIARDNEIIKAIENACDKFWNYHVKENIAPDLTSLNDYRLKFPTSVDTYTDATPEILTALNNIKTVRSAIKSREAQIAELQKEIFAFIGANAGIKQDDKILCTWKSRKDGVRVFRLSEK